MDGSLLSTFSTTIPRGNRKRAANRGYTIEKAQHLSPNFLPCTIKTFLIVFFFWEIIDSAIVERHQNLIDSMYYFK